MVTASLVPDLDKGKPRRNDRTREAEMHNRLTKHQRGKQRRRQAASAPRTRRAQDQFTRFTGSRMTGAHDTPTHTMLTNTSDQRNTVYLQQAAQSECRGEDNSTIAYQVSMLSQMPSLFALWLKGQRKPLCSSPLAVEPQFFLFNSSRPLLRRCVRVVIDASRHCLALEQQYQ